MRLYRQWPCDGQSNNSIDLELAVHYRIEKMNITGKKEIVESFVSDYVIHCNITNDENSHIAVS